MSNGFAVRTATRTVFAGSSGLDNGVRECCRKLRVQNSSESDFASLLFITANANGITPIAANHAQLAARTVHSELNLPSIGAIVSSFSMSESCSISVAVATLSAINKKTPSVDSLAFSFDASHTRRLPFRSHKSVGRWFDASTLQDDANIQNFNVNEFVSISKNTSTPVPDNLAGKSDSVDGDLRDRNGLVLTLADSDGGLVWNNQLKTMFPLMQKMGIVVPMTPFVTGLTNTLFINGTVLDGGLVGLAMPSVSKYFEPSVTYSFQNLTPITQEFMEISSCQGNIILTLDTSPATAKILESIALSSSTPSFSEHLGVHQLQESFDAKISSDNALFLEITSNNLDSAYRRVYRIIAGDLRKGNIAVDTLMDLRVGMRVRFLYRPKKAFIRADAGTTAKSPLRFTSVPESEDIQSNEQKELESNKNKINQESEPISCLLDDNAILLLAICHVPFVGETASIVSNGILTLLTHCDSSGPFKNGINCVEILIKRLLNFKIRQFAKHQKNLNDILRDNSVTTLLLTNFIRSQGSNFLSNRIFPALESLTPLLPLCEMDPKNLSSDDNQTCFDHQISESQKNLVAACVAVIDAITENASEMPNVICRLCTFIKSSINKSSINDENESKYVLADSSETPNQTFLDARVSKCTDNSKNSSRSNSKSTVNSVSNLDIFIPDESIPLPSRQPSNSNIHQGQLEQLTAPGSPNSLISIPRSAASSVYTLAGASGTHIITEGNTQPPPPSLITRSRACSSTNNACISTAAIKASNTAHSSICRRKSTQSSAENKIGTTAGLAARLWSLFQTSARVSPVAVNSVNEEEDKFTKPQLLGSVSKTPEKLHSKNSDGNNPSTLDNSTNSVDTSCFAKNIAVITLNSTVPSLLPLPLLNNIVQQWIEDLQINVIAATPTPHGNAFLEKLCNEDIKIFANNEHPQFETECGEFLGPAREDEILVNFLDDNEDGIAAAVVLDEFFGELRLSRQSEKAAYFSNLFRNAVNGTPRRHSTTKLSSSSTAAGFNSTFSTYTIPQARKSTPALLQTKNKPLATETNGLFKRRKSLPTPNFFNKSAATTAVPIDPEALIFRRSSKRALLSSKILLGFRKQPQEEVLEQNIAITRRNRGSKFRDLFTSERRSKSDGDGTIPLLLTPLDKEVYAVQAMFLTLSREMKVIADTVSNASEFCLSDMEFGGSLKTNFGRFKAWCEKEYAVDFTSNKSRDYFHGSGGGIFASGKQLTADITVFSL
ncbi:hypothetical protein HK100_008001 [Physocladia obscura]|uniref:Ras-GAP domain-containing protein n=1 Tax=Physocladia obscura TaxID=109957 RepID=A0AAD5XFN3_9FUNG|nr:hypothetical protein HK100_008001 [Physocladia obscura]